MKVGIDSDGDLREFLDATAVGGMTQAQFTDLVEWYSEMDADFAKFVEEKREAARVKPAK